MALHQWRDLRAARRAEDQRRGKVTTPAITGRIAQYPHCEARVLHAPGVCEYCDGHPDWQELRRTWGIAFTGDEPVTDAYGNQQLPCPADFNRGDSHQRWGGNTAKPPGGVTMGYDAVGYEVRITRDAFDAMAEETQRLLLELAAKLADDG